MYLWRKWGIKGWWLVKWTTRKNLHKVNSYHGLWQKRMAKYYSLTAIAWRAGLRESCTHVASLLWVIASGVQRRESQTVTDKGAYCTKHGAIDKVPYYNSIMRWKFQVLYCKIMLPCIGHRSELYDSLNPDWAPSLFLGYKGIASLRTNPASEATAATCTAAIAGHSSTLVNCNLYWSKSWQYNCTRYEHPLKRNMVRRALFSDDEVSWDILWQVCM